MDKARVAVSKELAGLTLVVNAAITGPHFLRGQFICHRLWCIFHRQQKLYLGTAVIPESLIIYNTLDIQL